ncbi:MAG: molybdate ABC transporter substrate-binding protein [Syntrophobacteraceae bacterium]|nr:molybdate ABC transporter substrate-binding protein [Syntrophobacteraceae bacterium]
MNGNRTFRSVFAVLLGVSFLAGLNVSAKAQGNVTVFAAASLTNALGNIGKLFTEKNKAAFTPSYLSSSTLAKQIENGAPANVFISADEKWMDYLANKKLIDPATRSNLLGNKLVLIAPVGSKVTKVDIAPGFNLAGLLAGGKLSMGDPAHVPAGIYGKQALETLGAWKNVSGSVARASNVREALLLVERGETPFGVVYATDAAISKKVKVVGVFPENTHPPIVYPAALVIGHETAEAKSFLEFLKTPQARAIFEKYGFSVLK